MVKTTVSIIWNFQTGVLAALLKLKMSVALCIVGVKILYDDTKSKN